MASIILFHSVLGLRAIERVTAERFRAAGHSVRTPDLFEGQTAATLAAGIAMMQQIGWDVICHRARTAIADAPEAAVLAGFSMGAGVVSSLWPDRPKASAVLLFHGPVRVPANADPCARVQAHFAQPDGFAPAEAVQRLRDEAAAAGLAPEIFLYDGAGHFFTDPALADFDAEASDHAWRRVEALLASL